MQPTLEQQIAVLDRARKKIIANPEKFNMKYCHSPYGTTNCIAGWIRINEDPNFSPIKYTYKFPGVFPRVFWEQESKSVAFAENLVPNFTGMFNATTKAALDWLKSREYAKEKL